MLPLGPSRTTCAFPRALVGQIRMPMPKNIHSAVESPSRVEENSYIKVTACSKQG